MTPKRQKWWDSLPATQKYLRREILNLKYKRSEEKLHASSTWSVMVRKVSIMRVNNYTAHIRALEYILSVLTERELLEQLAEEAAELSQAALKLIRAEGLSNNTTPITAGQARTNLQEEFSDVLTVAELLELIDCHNDKKLQRWAERLGHKDIEDDEEKGELIKAAEKIKAYCANRDGCIECPFRGKDGMCLVDSVPSEWENV